MIQNHITTPFELELSTFSFFAEYLVVISALYYIVLLTALHRTVRNLCIPKNISENIAVILSMSCYLVYNDDILFLQTLSFNNSIVNGSLTFFSKFMTCFFSAIFFFIISDFLEEQKLVNFEYLVILLFSVLGLMLLCSSYDLLTSYLSIELISLSSYLLAAFRKDSFYSVDAGLKYFIIGSVSSAFFLLGSSFIYALSGTIFFSDLLELTLNKVEYDPAYVDSATYYASVIDRYCGLVDLEEALGNNDSKSAHLLTQMLAWEYYHGPDWQKHVATMFLKEQLLTLDYLVYVKSTAFYESLIEKYYGTVNFQEVWSDSGSKSAGVLMQRILWEDEHGLDWREHVATALLKEHSFADNLELSKFTVEAYHESIIAKYCGVIDIEEAFKDHASKSADLLLLNLVWEGLYGWNWREEVAAKLLETYGSADDLKFFQSTPAYLNNIITKYCGPADMEEALKEHNSESARVLMQWVAWEYSYGLEWQKHIAAMLLKEHDSDHYLEFLNSTVAYYDSIIEKYCGTIDIVEAFKDHNSSSADVLMQRIAWEGVHGSDWREHVATTLVKENYDELLKFSKKTFFFESLGMNKFKIMQLGVSFILFSIFVKLALAPFHLWSLDVYEGSPTTSTFFFAVITKLSLFVFLIRFCYVAAFAFVDDWQFYSICVALVSVFVGSLGGITQHKLKTLLAYSSVSHMGYSLLAFSTATLFGVQMLLFYLVIYMLSGVCTWYIIMLLRLKTPNNNKYSKELTDLSLLSKSNPGLAFALSVTMFSLAGLPPLVGFLAKFGIFLTLLHSKFYFVCVFAVLCSVISTFYYIRIVKIMYFENVLVGKLYHPIKTNKIIFLSFFIFLLLFLFVNPNLLLLVIHDVIYDSLINGEFSLTK